MNKRMSLKTKLGIKRTYDEEECISSIEEALTDFENDAYKVFKYIDNKNKDKADEFIEYFREDFGYLTQNSLTDLKTFCSSYLKKYNKIFGKQESARFPERILGRNLLESENYKYNNLDKYLDICFQCIKESDAAAKGADKAFENEDKLTAQNKLKDLFNSYKKYTDAVNDLKEYYSYVISEYNQAF